MDVYILSHKVLYLSIKEATKNIVYILLTHVFCQELVPYTILISLQTNNSWINQKISQRPRYG